MRFAPSQIIHFDSPEAYHDWHESTPALPRALVNSTRRSFTGGLDFDGARSKLLVGSIEHMDRAQKILDKLNVSDLITNNMRILESSVTGFVPNVAAYLSGHPESMLNVIETDMQSPVSPIKVVVHTSVGSWLTDENIVSRGVAVLAFVMAMNLVRPVDLYCVHAASLHAARSPAVWGTCVKVASRPLDMARAVWMLTSPAYPRSLGISSVYRISGYDRTINDGVPFAFGGENDKRYIPGMRGILELDEKDVLINMALNRYGDNLEMVNDPIAWVNKMVKLHSQH